MNPAELEILKRAEAGFARIIETEDPKNPLFQMYHYQNRRWMDKQQNYHLGRARYTCQGQGKKRTTVYKNRAVWIITNRKPIPPGNFVDHIDGDKTNDNPQNLQLHGCTASHRQGNNVQLDTIIEDLGDWFALRGWLEF